MSPEGVRGGLRAVQEGETEREWEVGEVKPWELRVSFIATAEGAGALFDEVLETEERLVGVMLSRAQVQVMGERRV